MLDRFFKKKRPAKLYFALAVADKPLDDAKFEAAKDCGLFIVTGEMDKREGIPHSTLRGVMERFLKPDQPKDPVGDLKNIDDDFKGDGPGIEGSLKISEKKI